MPFKSEKQSRYFFAKAKTSKKFKKMAEEFASKTDYRNLPEQASMKKHMKKKGLLK